MERMVRPVAAAGPMAELLAAAVTEAPLPQVALMVAALSAAAVTAAGEQLTASLRRNTGMLRA